MSLLLVGGGLLAGSITIRAQAGGLRIEPVLLREPTYVSGSPRYCLLVFGPNADTRVWLVLDGDTLYVDRNGNGDLTEPGEQINAPNLQELSFGRYRRQRLISVGDLHDGEHVHHDVTLFQGQLNPEHALASAAPGEEARIRRHLRDDPEGWIYRVTARVDRTPPGKSRRRRALHVTQQAGADSSGLLRFSGRYQDAPILHFNGPLRLEPIPDQTLAGGNHSVDLHVRLATPGVGPGATTVLDHDAVPLRSHPTAEVQFPGAEKPVRVSLTRRC